MTEQATTGSIAPYFDQFFNQIKNVHPKIDPELLIRIMLFEINLKKFVGPDIPHVHLDVQYEQGVDLKQKQEEGRDKFPIEITTNKWGDGRSEEGPLQKVRNEHQSGEMSTCRRDEIRLHDQLSCASLRHLLSFLFGAILCVHSVRWRCR